jgi:hypothetical protein
VASINQHVRLAITWGVVTTAALAGAAGCGGAASGAAGGHLVVARLTAEQLGCPKTTPPLQLSRPASLPPAAGSLARSHPLVAIICQYAQPSGKSGFRPPRRIVLQAVAADGLTAIVDNAQPLNSAARRCAAQARLLGLTQLIRFAYPAGASGSILVSYTACSIAVVTTDGRTGILTSPIQDDLFGYTTAGTTTDGPQTPDVVGLTAMQARAAAHRARFSLQLDGTAMDARVPFGTVIFQSLPAGWRTGMTGGGQQIDAITAVGPAPPCTASQLAARYLGGSPGAGNFLGMIVIRNISPRPCQLAGPVGIIGIGRNGHPDTSAVTLPIGFPAILSPRAAALPAHDSWPPGEVVASIQLIAEYRDDPASPDGLCTSHQVSPAAWQITLPAAQLRISDTFHGPGSFLPSGAFLTCRGHLGAFSPVAVGHIGPAS